MTSSSVRPRPRSLRSQKNCDWFRDRVSRSGDALLLCDKSLDRYSDSVGGSPSGPQSSSPRFCGRGRFGSSSFFFF